MKARGIDWDAQPLGAMPDKTLARALAVHHKTVAEARRARGIKAYDPRADGAVESRKVHEKNGAPFVSLYLSSLGVAVGDSVRVRWSRDCVVVEVSR
jgi:hypothetical protein